MEIRSPRRQVGADFRAQSPAATLKLVELFREKNKKQQQPAVGKGASTPADGVATGGVKRAHLDDFLVECGAGGRRRGRRVDTVVERACQLQSLSRIGVCEPTRGSREEAGCKKNKPELLFLRLVNAFAGFGGSDPCVGLRGLGPCGFVWSLWPNPTVSDPGAAFRCASERKESGLFLGGGVDASSTDREHEFIQKLINLNYKWRDKQNDPGRCKQAVCP